MLTKVFAALVIVASLAVAGAAWSGAFSTRSDLPTPTSQVQESTETPACCSSGSKVSSCCEEKVPSCCSDE